MPRSLFGRALLIIVTPLILLQLVTAYIFFERHWGDVGRRLALGVAGDIAFLIAALDELPEGPERVWLFRRTAFDKEVQARLEPGARLTDPPQQVAFNQLDRILDRTLRERLFHPYRFDTRSVPDLVTVWVEIPEGVLTAEVPVKRLFSTSVYAFVLWMVGTSIILLAIAIYFLTRQLRPIRRLARAAEGFGRGVISDDFKPEGAAEVRQAAMAFVEMRERILRQITQRTEMLAGVSHDLRTPLTRMKLELAMLPEGDAADNLRTDVADMERMLEEYLDFARGAGGEQVREVDCGALLTEVVEAARRNGAEVALVCPAEATLAVRPNAIKRAVTNLVENAARHGRHVWITGHRMADSFDVRIEDDGPGIPDDQREAVFKPFYRIEGSRNPDTGGVGLGLTIARDIARSHGGDVVLDSAPGGGLSATLRLPA